ncbi:MAG: alpha/beta hydrolase [Leptolyngbyaceae cyanobacterium MO_188.B28]|nr:alpha/beta hydrolase [Leptolyngbyaceae cyanobacterium MO_188.B28]
MFPDFLPSDVQNLTEATSIALAQGIQRQPIDTPLADAPILTAFVQQGQGDPPPILLLHGFDSSVLEFRRLFPLLAAKAETWTMDLLGFGFTDRTGIPGFDPGSIKLHLHSFWRQKIRRPMVLIGASMGGAAAIDFVLTYPDCVEKLVLIDAVGFATESAMTKLMFPPFDGWATAFLRNPWVRRRISQTAYCDRSFVTPDAELCASLHLQLPNWSEALIAFTKSGGYTFLSQKISQIQPPTLIIWGEQDKILGRQDASRFEQAIVNGQLIWTPDCGHVPHLEKPQSTAQTILEYLEC